MRCDGRGLRQGGAQAQVYKPLMPYSSLGISKLTRREAKNWLASPRRRGAAPQCRSQIVTSEFATRSCADARVPTYTRGVGPGDEPRRRVRERCTTAATRTRQGSTTTTSWFLPSCELRSVVSVHVQAIGIFSLFIFNPN